MLQVKLVKPKNNNTLLVELSNGKTGIFDVKPYQDKGIFTELNDLIYFKQVKLYFGGVAWPNGQDFSADTIEYELQEQTERTTNAVAESKSKYGDK